MKKLSYILIMVILLLAPLLLSQEKKLSTKWSANQGILNWKAAKAKCISIRMRLPTIKELEAAYEAGVTKSWKKDHHLYWSSTLTGDGDAYGIDVEAGGVYDYSPKTTFRVRCIL